MKRNLCIHAEFKEAIIIHQCIYLHVLLGGVQKIIYKYFLLFDTYWAYTNVNRVVFKMPINAIIIIKKKLLRYIINLNKNHKESRYYIKKCTVFYKSFFYIY